MAAKRTSDWIPLTHALSLDAVDVAFGYQQRPAAVTIEVKVRTTGRTGVEMEALTAVAAAGLTLVDMLKAVDRTLVIGDIALWEKRGGRSGEWKRQRPAAGTAPKSRPAAASARRGTR